MFIIDDITFWSVGRISGIRRDKFRFGIIQNFAESWKSIAGTFNAFHKADNTRTYILGICQLIIRLTWSLPNELLAVIISYVLIEISGAKTDLWENTQLVTMNRFMHSAFSIGSKTIGQNSGVLNDHDIRKHEQGHYYQSLLLGALYLIVIGIPSITHNRYYYYKSKSGKAAGSYYDFYTEAWANQMADIDIK